MKFFPRILIILALLAGSLQAAELPAGFVEEKLLAGINAGTAIAIVLDGRILVAEQTGKLRVIKNGKALPTPLLDLTARVDSFWERGLIGVAVHPGFPRTPHLFVLYVAAQPYPHHVLSRFVMLGDTAQMDSEQILLVGDDQSKRGGKHPAGHQGGPLRFGPDGKLYVAIGEPIIPSDGACTSQMLDTLSGKILRLNADGSIPTDNPFYAQTTGKYRAIWAIGLRNPFGLAFQSETGRLFETDVGQTSWEEVNEIVRGSNYGWPLAEGMSTNAAFRNPLHAYPPVIGRSIVGATFYPRAPKPESAAGLFPEKWRGKFFFADWAAHWVKALDPDAPTNVVTFAKGFDAPVAVEVAPDGSLLVLNRGTIWRDEKKFASNSGALVRIRYTSATGGPADHRPSRTPLPRTLAASELFTSLAPLTARGDFVPFEINVPPWQPGIQARRWISLPVGGKLGVNAEGEFEFPTDTIVVQHFTVEKTGAPFETHALWFIGPRTARAAAYRWNADAKAGTLIEDGEVVSLPGDPARRWFSPGTEEQLTLDGVVVGFLLPLNPRQLNRDRQLADWSARGWLKEPPGAESTPRLAALDDLRAPLELRVRSYLDANCAACHRPGGPSRGNFDARFATPLGEQKLLDGELAAGDLGIAGARVVVPGHPGKSVLLRRLEHGDAFRMPPVSVNAEAQPIVPVLRQWIESLPDRAGAK